MRRTSAVRFGAMFALAQFLYFNPGPACAQGAAATPDAGAQQGQGWNDLRGQMDKTTAPAATPKPVAPDVAPPPPAPDKTNGKGTTLTGTIRTDFWIAFRMAGDPLLYKMAQAEPSIVAAICEHPWAAKRLANNRHLAEIADADHYLCRRLTQWSGSTWALVKNPQADRVIAHDPEGIYRAIDKDPSVAHALAKNVMFNEMITENPDLGRFIASHM